ncbi:flagellar biosynthetic protein FliO [Bacillus tianshenii]|nr:flagellar biosynthetic protein FliO [Bacillus tianshenii]
MQKCVRILALLLFILFLPHGPIAYAEGQNGPSSDSEGTVDEYLKEMQDKKQQEQKDTTSTPQQKNEQQPGTENEELDNQSNEAPPTFEGSFSWLDLVKLFFALFFVVALIYLLLRLVNQKNKVFGNAKALENVGGISLGNNRSIQIVRLGERILVVGVGETITLIKEIESEEEVAEIIEAQHKALSLQPNTDLFARLLNRPTKESQSKHKDQFKNQLKEQLDEMAKGRKEIYDSIKDEENDK